MIDFTNCAVNKFKAYGGANGNKINVLYNGTSYMLKFPPVPSKSKVMSYSGSCISEYLACHILASIGLPVQDMPKVLGDESEINQRIYTFPTSAIVDSGKKISYFDFISSLQNAECSEALAQTLCSSAFLATKI